MGKWKLKIHIHWYFATCPWQVDAGFIEYWHPSINWSINRLINQSIHPSIHLPSFLSSFLCSFLPTFLSYFLSLIILPSLLPSIHPSIHPSIQLSFLPAQTLCPKWILFWYQRPYREYQQLRMEACWSKVLEEDISAGICPCQGLSTKDKELVSWNNPLSGQF